MIKYKFIVSTFILFIVTLFFSATARNAGDSVLREKYIYFKPVIDSLVNRGVDYEFINRILSDTNTKFNEKYIKINITGYLKKSKPTDYSHNYNERAILKTRIFLQDNLEALTIAEKKYQVKKEVIVSILWVETKCGEYLGTNQIPSVFFSTALSNQQKYIELNISMLDSFNISKTEQSELIKKIYQRSEKKSQWALNEIVAMYNIEKSSVLRFNGIYGSWAGAFGLSQFLPSSFYQWAIDGNGDGIIDLFSVRDAIFSVANYLKVHGWNNNSKEAQKKAIFAYNNSTSYVNAVLMLADKIKTNK